MKTQVTMTTERRMTLKVTGQQIVDFLNSKLDSVRIPADANVVIAIPGGGDWSNTELDVDERHPVQVSWTERETAESEFAS